MQMKDVRTFGQLGAIGLAGLLAACGGGGDGGMEMGQGTIRFAVTDAPACGYDEVNVTIERVRVHRSSGAADDDSGWEDVEVSPAKRVTLLDLTNGVLEELGSEPVPAGLAPSALYQILTSSIVDVRRACRRSGLRVSRTIGVSSAVSTAHWKCL